MCKLFFIVPVLYLYRKMKFRNNSIFVHYIYKKNKNITFLQGRMFIILEGFSLIIAVSGLTVVRWIKSYGFC